MQLIDKILSFLRPKEKIEPIVPIKPYVEKPKPLIDDMTFSFVLPKVFLKQFNLTQYQGILRISNVFFESGNTDLRHLAYILATAYHETWFTFEPVVERGSEEYLKSKSYYPYVGRGYVQLTHKSNYEKYGITELERALDPDLAAFIIVDGMTRGIFTGRKLSNYFNDTVNDPFNARKIINLLDKAQLISEYHKKFLRALELSKPDEGLS